MGACSARNFIFGLRAVLVGLRVGLSWLAIVSGLKERTSRADEFRGFSLPVYKVWTGFLTSFNRYPQVLIVRSKTLVIVGFAVTIAVSTANEGVCHHALSRRVDWMTAVNYTTVVDCKWQAIYLVTWYSGGVFGGNKVGDEA